MPALRTFPCGPGTATVYSAASQKANKYSDNYLHSEIIGVVFSVRAPGETEGVHTRETVPVR